MLQLLWQPVSRLEFRVLVNIDPCVMPSLDASCAGPALCAVFAATCACLCARSSRAVGERFCFANDGRQEGRVDCRNFLVALASG